MRLIDWISREKVTPSQFASRIGVTQAAMHRYLHARRIPTRAIMLRIYDATDGKVAPNDWYGFPAGKKKRRGDSAPPAIY